MIKYFLIYLLLPFYLFAAASEEDRRGNPHTTPTGSTSEASEIHTDPVPLLVTQGILDKANAESATVKKITAGSFNNGVYIVTHGDLATCVKYMSAEDGRHAGKHRVRVETLLNQPIPEGIEDRIKVVVPTAVIPLENGDYAEIQTVAQGICLREYLNDKTIDYKSESFRVLFMNLGYDLFHLHGRNMHEDKKGDLITAHAHDDAHAGNIFVDAEGNFSLIDTHTLGKHACFVDFQAFTFIPLFSQQWLFSSDWPKLMTASMNFLLGYGSQLQQVHPHFMDAFIKQFTQGINRWFESFEIYWGDFEHRFLEEKSPYQALMTSLNKTEKIYFEGIEETITKHLEDHPTFKTSDYFMSLQDRARECQVSLLNVLDQLNCDLTNHRLEKAIHE